VDELEEENTKKIGMTENERKRKYNRQKGGRKQRGCT